MARAVRQKKVRKTSAKAAVLPTANVRKGVTFEYRTKPGSAVFIGGSFNYWNTTETRLRDRGGNGCFRVAIALSPGRYEYKFFVNGRWCVDPDCPDPIVNRFNTLNAVVVVA